MANYAEYFAKVAYKPTYFIGDRVKGYWNKIPFRGTVGNDSKLNEYDPARVSVHLDLPIKFKNKIYTVIMVEHKDISLFK